MWLVGTSGRTGVPGAFDQAQAQAGRRFAHFQLRSTIPVCRARTGVPSRDSARSAASAPVVAYLPAGPRAIAFVEHLLEIRPIADLI